MLWIKYCIQKIRCKKLFGSKIVYYQKAFLFLKDEEKFYVSDVRENGSAEKIDLYEK